MQVLPVIVPYIKTTSNIAISCRALRDWLFNNGFPIRASKGGLGLENLSFYKLLEHPDLNNWTYRAFDDAIREDDTNKLLLLLQKGADIEARYHRHNFTALICAGSCGSTNCLQLLLENKANIEAKSSWKGTALIHATINGRIDCLKLLLENKANTEAKGNSRNTAIMFAVRLGEIDCIKILLQSGAQVDPGLRKNYPQYAELWGDSTL